MVEGSEPGATSAPAAPFVPPPGEDESYFWGLRPGRPTTTARPVGWYPTSEDGLEDYWDGRSWTARRQAVDGGWVAVTKSGAPAPQRVTPNAADAEHDEHAEHADHAGGGSSGPVMAPVPADVPRGFPGASAPTRLTPEESYFYGLRPGQPASMGRPVGWYPSGGDDSGQEDFWDGRSWTARRQRVNGAWASVPIG